MKKAQKKKKKKKKTKKKKKKKDLKYYYYLQHCLRNCLFLLRVSFYELSDDSIFYKI